MNFKLRCDRQMRYAERVPYDGSWRLTCDSKYATTFETVEEAEAAIPAALADCGLTPDELAAVPTQAQRQRLEHEATYARGVQAFFDKAV